MACASLFVGSAALSDTISAMEYYVDTDPGQGNATPMPPVDGSYDGTRETGQVTLDTTGLKPGPHMVYVRAKRSGGVWGTCPPVLLYVYQRTAVIEAEYYIDSDPGEGNGTALQARDGWFDFIHEAVTATVPINGLSYGNHTLHVRAKNSAGIWGPSHAIPFEVLPPVTVAAAECGLGTSTDTEPTLGTWPMQADDFVFDATVESIVKRGVPLPSEAGDYRVFVRAKNGRDMWGSWAFADFTIAVDKYDEWVTLRGMTGANTAKDGDYDQDGVLNVIEYAFNLDPTQPDGDNLMVGGSGTNGLPCWSFGDVPGSPRLKVEFVRRRNDSGLAYDVRFTGSLVEQAWVASGAPETVTPIDADWERVEMQDDAAHVGNVARFGTVRIGWQSE